jgi:hypothetical protein
MHFCSSDRVKQVFEGKKVAIVGSGPSTKTNEPDFIDSHDVVVRVNNYKIVPRENTGSRTDVHYSFYGTSIKKTAAELKSDGVYLCMCKCPDTKFIESRWHERNGKLNGIDFRYIYEFRKDFWFTDTFVPSLEDFLAHFELLGKHVPTTGFSAILDVLKYNPASIYITGFDFFQSRVHNFNERWRRNNPSDPIGHRPEAEYQWLLKNYHKHPISMDVKLKSVIKTHNRIRGYGL